MYSVVLGLAMLYSWIKAFGLLEYASFVQGVALLIWQAFLPVALFQSLKVIFLHGSDNVNLPDSEFIISPIIATFITLHGEVALIFLGIMSIPATLLTWFSASFVIPVGTGDGFISGIVVFVGSWVLGFVICCLVRLIRKWTMAIFSIARNVDMINQHHSESNNPVLKVTA